MNDLVLAILERVVIDLTVYIAYVLFCAALVPCVLIVATPFILAAAALEPTRFRERAGRYCWSLWRHLLDSTGLARRVRRRRAADR